MRLNLGCGNLEKPGFVGILEALKHRRKCLDVPLRRLRGLLGFPREGRR